MFENARINLTLWYLLIIMIVSSFFSLIVYRGFTKELGRGFRFQAYTVPEQRLFVQKQNGFTRILPFFIYPDEVPPQEFSEIISLAKRRFALQLLIVNGGILILAGTSGYFLAGKTLQPIEEALEEQKRFVADASHEFKTPLTSLQTSIEVALRDKKLTLKNAKVTLSESLNDIEKLSKLSSNLLSLARFKNTGHFPKEKIRLDKILSKATEKIKPLALTKKINIALESDEISITANEESIEKLVMILLDNAIKYTPSGKNIKVSLVKKRKNAILSVKDEGIGISKKDLPHIFERFYRADTSRSKAISGFGLGLSMAKQIVHLHEGEITINSELGKGSTIKVVLPS